MTPGSRIQQDRGRRAGHWRAVTATLVALTVVLVATICSTAAAVPRGDCNGRIAFDSVREGKRSIYLTDPPPSGATIPTPGAPVTPLTNGDEDAKPSWSPPSRSGCTPDESVPPPTQIAFQRTSNGNTDIYRLDAASPEPAGTPDRVTTDPAADTAPAWAPDSIPGSPSFEPIAFERNINGKRDIFIATADGVIESNLTSTPDVDEANPEWSSRSSYLTFDSDQGGRREIWVMDVIYNANSGEFESLAKRQVTAGPAGSSFNPSWFMFTEDLPNEQDPGAIDWIAFAGTDTDGGDSQIHVVESPRVGPPFSQVDPNENYRLTTNPSDDTAPAWSPLGDRIAYQSNRDGNAEIYVMDPFEEGENDVNLTQFPGSDQNPDWEAPAGPTAVAFPVRPRGRRSRQRRARIASVTPPDGSGTPELGRREPGRPERGRPEPSTPKDLGTPKRLGCTIPGTARNDVLRGTASRDVLCGKGGDDRIVGLGGNDLIRGDAGNDRLKGSDGDDEIRGGAGNDHLHGGRGSDDISGGPGGDRINAKDRQRDRISGGPGGDRAAVDRRDRVRGVERLRR
jgi:WD40 repeat protein/hemolysin type calcium-binding protein